MAERGCEIHGIGVFDARNSGISFFCFGGVYFPHLPGI
jgi:hypothetical protein